MSKSKIYKLNASLFLRSVLDHEHSFLTSVGEVVVARADVVVRPGPEREHYALERGGDIVEQLVHPGGIARDGTAATCSGLEALVVASRKHSEFQVVTSHAQLPVKGIHDCGVPEQSRGTFTTGLVIQARVVGVWLGNLDHIVPVSTCAE